MEKGLTQLRELEDTLRVCDAARGKLSLALEKALGEIARLRGENKRLYDEIEKLLSRKSQGELDFDRLRQELEKERLKFISEVNKALEQSETIRREGLDALEQAKSLRGKAGA